MNPAGEGDCSHGETGRPEPAVIKEEKMLPREEFQIIPSPLFPGLVEICREDGPYVCFNQLRARYLQNLPRGTLSGWVHRLEIAKLRCTDKEHAILKCIVPEEKGKPFFLVKPKHAQQLLDRSRDRLPDLRIRAVATNPGFNGMGYSTVSASTPAMLLPTVGEPWRIPSTATALQLPQPPAQQVACGSPKSPPCYQLDSQLEGIEQRSNEDDRQSDLEDETADTPVSPPPESKHKSRIGHTIPDKEMSLSLKRDLVELTDFYTANFEGRRRGPGLAQPTMDKIIEHLKMYFYYIKHCRCLEPKLSHLENRPLLEDYATYLTEVRHLKAVTISRNIHGLEKGLLFVLRDTPAHERDQSEPLAALRNMRLQCEKAARLDKVKDREGVGCKPKQNLIYAEILELCRELKSSFEEERNTLQKARKLHDLVLLLVYLHFVARTHEVRTLVVEEDCPAGDIVPVGPPERENVIAFYDDGSIELLLTRYKTDKTYGPCKVPVAYSSPIAYYLRQYAGKFRQKLLLGSDHAYYFVNSRGQEFGSASAFSKYLSQIIESGTGKRGAANSIRHAIATKFIADPELCANEAFRNSLSRVMRHSRETQEKCYVDLTNAARSEQALGVLSQSAGNELFGDCINTDKPGKPGDSSHPTSDSEDEHELQPTVGDLVALVDPQSTSQDPVIFIAKVIRFSTGRDEAILAEFEEVEEDCFRLKITSCRPWVESVNSLIWPIDIAYDAESRAYKLRSPKCDIYESVVSPRKKRKMDPTED